MSAPTVCLVEPDLFEAQAVARPVISRILHRRPQDVEDILQQAALEALLKQESFKGTCKYATWFTRIAINQAFMLLRRANTVFERNNKSLDNWGSWNRYGEGCLADSLPSKQPSALESLWASEWQGILREEIAKLSPKLQEEARLTLSGEGPKDDNARKGRRWHLRQQLRPALEERGVRP